MKQTTISDWERGHIPQSLIWISGIARRLDVSVDYILGLTDDPRPAQRTSEEWPIYVQELLDVFGQLWEWRQRELVFIARGMLTAQEEEMAASEDVLAGMERLFGYVEDEFGADLADQLEAAMSSLLSADEATLRRLAEFLESADEGGEDAEV